MTSTTSLLVAETAGKASRRRGARASSLREGYLAGRGGDRRLEQPEFNSDE